MYKRRGSLKFSRHHGKNCMCEECMKRKREREREGERGLGHIPECICPSCMNELRNSSRESGSEKSSEKPRRGKLGRGGIKRGSRKKPHKFGTKHSHTRSRKRSHSSIRYTRSGPRGGKIYIKPRGMSCKAFLKRKIGDNLHEFSTGKTLSNGRKIFSRSQAIAIGYDQARKAGCRV